MAETETKETTVSKVIANVLKAAREQSEQLKSEKVAEVMRRIYPEKTATPGTKQLRAGRIIENAKNVVAEAKAQGVHVSTGLHEWVGRNKLPVLDEDPAQAFKIAKADLALAIKASDLPKDHWVIQAASRVKTAESAEALAIVALAPKEVRENPNFIFQTAAQLAGSNLDPETQVTTKAFVAELKNLRGVDGFEMSDHELSQALTEGGLGAVPAPPPPEEFQGQDISNLPDSAKHVFMAMNEDLLAAGVAKLDKVSLEEREKIAAMVFRVIKSYDTLIGNIDTSGFDKDKNQIFAKLSFLKDNLEFRVSPEQGIDAAIIAKWAGVPLDTIKDKSPLRTRFSREKVQAILKPGRGEEPSGADQYYEQLSDRIFTSGKEAHAADLTDQYEYSDFEQILRYAFGEETPLINKYRERWNYDYPRNAVITRILGGHGGEKELIQLAGSISSDTLNYETRVRFAPEVIAQAELILPRLAAEDRYQYDKNVEYVTQEYPNPPDEIKKLAKEKYGKKTLNKAQVWTEFSTTQSKYFPGDEYKRMDAAMRAGHGSMVHDRWIVANMPEQINIASLTRSLEAEINSKWEPNMVPDEKKAIVNSVVAPYKERLRTLWKKVTLKDVSDENLFDPRFLEKIRGLSPYEIMLFNWLEKMKPDTQVFELRKAILAQRRFMVGSKRLFSIVGTLSNMPGLEFVPSGADVMVESLEYTMRAEQAERFIFARFGFGKEDVGKRIMAVEQEELCRLRGVTLGNKDGFKTAIKEDESIPMRRYRTVVTKARKAYGVGYTQLAVGTLLDSTCPFDYGTWRPEEAIVRVLNEKYGPDAENLALCIRLRMTGTGDGHGEKYDIRAPLVDKIIQREPSVLILRLGSKEFDETVLERNGIIPGTPEWDKFLTVLGHAEHRVFTEHDFFSKSALDLGNPDWFKEVFTDDVFLKAGVSKDAIPALKTKYLTIIQDVQRVFKTQQSGQTMSSADMWKKFGMPMTLSLADFNLEEADFQRLPQSSQFRGDVGDTTSRLEARNDFSTMIKDPNISMPEDVKKTLIPAAQKLGEDIIGYKDQGFTEERVGIMLDAILSQSAPSDIYRGMVQAVPFLPSLMRWVVGQDVSKGWVRTPLEPARHLSIGVAKLTGQKELADLLTHNIKEWPKIFGQEFISGTVGVKGGKANTPMAIGLNEIIEDIEHSGIITNHHILHKLRDKYKTRLGWRMLEGGYRFWWVPFTAAIAVGVIIALQEQGLESGGKSH